MTVNLSIKNASDEVVAALKSRARQNHRPLQGELVAIIEEAAASWLGMRKRAACAIPGAQASRRRATARRAGVSVLASKDFQDGRVVEGVRFANPFDPANTAIIAAAMGY